MVRSNRGVSHHLALTPIRYIKSTSRRVRIAVNRHHIRSQRRRRSGCRRRASRLSCPSCALINPDVIHQHLITEVAARNRPTVSTPDGHVQNNIHRVTKRPIGCSRICRFGVLKIRVVVVAIDTKTDVILRPPHLIGVKVSDGAAERRAFLNLRITIGPSSLVISRIVCTQEMQCRLNFIRFEVLLGPLHHIDFASIGPSAFAKQPDGWPCTL